MSSLDELATRKAVATARADLARMQLALCYEDLKTSVLPRPPGASSPGVRRTAAFLIAFAAPIIGRSRFSRMLRAASIAMSVWKMARMFGSDAR